MGHHFSHGLQAFMGSGFDDAGILVVDAVGDWSSTALYRGTWTDGVPRVERVLEIAFPHSLGLVYSAVTAYLGFRPNDSEATTMALAAFGEPIFADAFREIVGGTEDGAYEVDQTYFNFATTNAVNADLYDHFGLTGLSNNLFNQVTRGSVGQAMIAAQAITRGVSQCVSVALAGGIDHHDEAYETDHYDALAQGMSALERLIAYLDQAGVLERTTILVTSEFARTPTKNARGGRDHHLSNSCMVMGPGLAKGKVLGATDDDTWVFQALDPESGVLDTEGHAMRPPDIHATLLDSMGQSYDHLSNQSPVVLEALKKS